MPDRALLILGAAVAVSNSNAMRVEARRNRGIGSDRTASEIDPNDQLIRIS